MKALINGQYVDVPDVPNRTPVPPSPPVGHSPITGAQFLSNITVAEYVAISNFATSTMASGDPTVSLWLDGLRMGGTISPNDTVTNAAFNELIQAGIFTVQRVRQVISRR